MCWHDERGQILKAAWDFSPMQDAGEEMDTEWRII
jgi:hypothetical protein